MSAGTVLSWSAFVLAALAGVRGIWSPCGLSMLSAINPMSERSRGYRYWLTASWFVAGSLVGSLVIAAAGGLLAFVLSWTALSSGSLALVAAGLALLALASDRRLGGFQLPGHPRQVNELWLMQYRRWLYASGFGAQIGSGFATYIMTAANYLVVALAGLTASPLTAIEIGLCFGLVRGLGVLLSARCRTAGRLQRLHRRLAQLEPWSLRLVMAAEVVVAAVLAWSAVGRTVRPGFALAAVAVAAALVVGPACYRWLAQLNKQELNKQEPLQLVDR